jgi:hypothetical protein
LHRDNDFDMNPSSDLWSGDETQRSPGSGSTPNTDGQYGSGYAAYLEPLEVIPVIGGVERFGLLTLAFALSGVFVIAAVLNPYESQGTPRALGTHHQLGLPPCTFQVITGIPCPSCGMTTSFALVIRGDLVNAMRVNFAGALLAIACLAIIPWALASVWRGTLLFIRYPERVMLIGVLGLLGIMLLRWVVVVVRMWI